MTGVRWLRYDFKESISDERMRAALGGEVTPMGLRFERIDENTVRSIGPLTGGEVHRYQRIVDGVPQH